MLFSYIVLCISEGSVFPDYLEDKMHLIIIIIIVCVLGSFLHCDMLKNHFRQGFALLTPFRHSDVRNPSRNCHRKAATQGMFSRHLAHVIDKVKCFMRNYRIVPCNWHGRKLGLSEKYCCWGDSEHSDVFDI